MSDIPKEVLPALVVQEAVFDILRDNTREHHQFFTEIADDAGAWELRLQCVEVGTFFDAAFNRAEELCDGLCFDAVSYDFEVAPAIVDLLARFNAWPGSDQPLPPIDFVAWYIVARYASGPEAMAKIGTTWRS